MTDLFTETRAPMTLRPYQQAAVDAVYRHLREREDNPCVVIPTGGGKTPVIAAICRDAVTKWGGRVLVLAHVRELLEQTRDKLDAVCPGLHVGIYSAGMGKRDTTHPVIVAGIQSAHRKGEELGAFDLILVDEAHMIPPDGDGMYRQFLSEARKLCPHTRVIGMTATPFRMGSGPICSPTGILNSICYEVGVRELINAGFLSPLKSRAGQTRADLSGVHTRGGEYVAAELEQTMNTEELVMAACSEIVELTEDRKSVLIFCAGVEHGKNVAEAITELAGRECGFIDGTTPGLNRDDMIRRFKAGELKYLANVNVLSTGFDAPNVDTVAMLRPTKSPGLYYQMVGRGFRKADGKEYCRVLDFSDNVMTHGPVDQIRVREPGAKGDGTPPAKECPECAALIATGFLKCPECDYQFPLPERSTHGRSASDPGVLKDQMETKKWDGKVQHVTYAVHEKRGAPPGAPRTLRVNYHYGFHQMVSEWVCVEHPEGTFPRRKAEKWWAERCSLPCPFSADEALEMAEGDFLAVPAVIEITLPAGEKFERITRYDFAVPAVPAEPGEVEDDDDDAGAGASAGGPHPVDIPDDEIPF